MIFYLPVCLLRLHRAMVCVRWLHENSALRVALPTVLPLCTAMQFYVLLPLGSESRTFGQAAI